MEKRYVRIPNIHCGHCVHTIETELQELSGITSVKVDQEAKSAEITWKPPLSWDEIRSLLIELNYPPED